MSQNGANYNALLLTMREALRAQDEAADHAGFVAAHRVARAACEAVSKEARRLATVDRYGDWRGPHEKQMMVLGYL